MVAMFEPLFKAEDGGIFELCEGQEHYDIDWGYSSSPDYWLRICEDTPENQKKYNISI